MDCICLPDSDRLIRSLLYIYTIVMLVVRKFDPLNRFPRQDLLYLFSALHTRSIYHSTPVPIIAPIYPITESQYVNRRNQEDSNDSTRSNHRIRV